MCRVPRAVRRARSRRPVSTRHRAPDVPAAQRRLGRRRHGRLVDPLGIVHARPLVRADACGYVFAARYRIERVLGTGGMGTVYQAWDQELGIMVALKVIRSDIAADLTVAHDFEQRFKQELLMARQVTHRNVIRIYDLAESSGVKYITMQFVQGLDLDALLARGPLPFERVLGFAKQLAAGLASAHDVGVVHRDLKPKNILVDSTDTIYISDFGLARSTEATMAGLTRTGEIVGTPRYISPEQVQGKPADQRSDLYALGTIFFEMASGKRPFSGTSVIELMYQRVQQTPTDISSISAGPARILPSSGDAMSRTQSRRPLCQRPGTAEGFEAEHADAPVPLPPPSGRTVSITLPLPTTPRSKMAVASALIASVAIVALLARQYVVTRPTGVPVAARNRPSTSRCSHFNWSVINPRSHRSPPASKKRSRRSCSNCRL